MNEMLRNRPAELVHRKQLVIWSTILLSFWGIGTSCLAQSAPSSPAEEAATAARVNISQDDLQAMLSADSRENLEKRLGVVEENSPINAHSIRLLWAFRMRNVPVMKELLEKPLPAGWAMEENLFFESQDQYDSFMLLLKSAVAIEEGRPDEVRQMAGDIIWLYPGHAQIVADLLSEYRMNQQMKDVKVPMEMGLKTSQGENVTLAALVTDKRGILLDFWATWAGPTLEMMPQLVRRAESLGEQNLVVAGVNAESNERLAETVRKERAIRFPWLVEPEGAPLTVLLRVDSMPRSVLVDPQGNVLFNGHPNDPKLQEVLKGMGIELAK